MQFETHHQADIDTGGSSLQGYIDANFADLQAAFGPPMEGDLDRTDAEWALRFKDEATGDETIATIYNYKDGHAYLGPEGMDVEKITDWHVGGLEPLAVDLVQAALADARQGRPATGPQ